MPEGFGPTPYVPIATPVLGLSLVTELAPLFATQMLEPSKQMPTGLDPTGKLRCRYGCHLSKAICCKLGVAPILRLVSPLPSPEKLAAVSAPSTFALPLTSNSAVGLFVPMPTLPAPSIRIFGDVKIPSV